MKLTIRELKNFIRESMELEMARKKTVEKPGIPVDAFKVEGQHDIQFAHVYAATILVNFGMDGANVLVYMDDMIAHESDIQNDTELQDELKSSIEHFVGFPVRWVEGAFHSAHDGTVVRHAAAATKLDISYSEEV